jgi:ribonuclease VapC
VVVDSSALVALLLGESEADHIAIELANASDAVISAATLVEVMIVIESKLGAAGVLQLQQVVREANITTTPVTDDQALIACDGWRSFGRGRHPASLNFGDCFAYALARARADVLLCVGDDFRQTDIPTRP